MSTHKIIWYIALSAAVAAALVLWVRQAGEPTDNQDAPDELVQQMLDRLASDHPMEEPQTRAAVQKVADLAANGLLQTAEGHYALGLIQTDNEELDAAENAFNKAIQIRPQWSWPHNALGILLGNHRKEREPQAEAAFRKAIDLDPDWSRPHNDLAILLRLCERLEEAEQEALTALKLDPDSVATHNNYGNLLVAKGQLDKAEQEYQTAINLNPNHPKPYYNLACVYALRQKTDDALSLLEKSITLSPALRQTAQDDPDFNALRNNPRFQTIING